MQQKFVQLTGQDLLPGLLLVLEACWTQGTAQSWRPTAGLQEQLQQHQTLLVLLAIAVLLVAEPAAAVVLAAAAAAVLLVAARDLWRMHGVAGVQMKQQLRCCQAETLEWLASAAAAEEEPVVMA